MTALSCSPGATATTPVLSAPAQERPFRIARVMSFHSPWKWTDDQCSGFDSAFSGLGLEYRTWQLDAKRQSEAGPMALRAGVISREVLDWKPDLVYAMDDPALNLIVPDLARAAIPVVFSGVNSAVPPGLLETGMVSGVFEKEFFPEGLRLLQSIKPGIHRLAVIWDDDNLSWRGIVESIRLARQQFPGLEYPFFGSVSTFSKLKSLVTDEFPGKVDAICFIGVFGFKDESGHNVPYQDAMRWIAEHAPFPDMSFWEDRVDHGTLCGVCVTGQSQGQEAGNLARRILLGRERPADMPPMAGTGGQPMISLRRANALGIPVNAGLLLNSVVKKSYRWDSAELAP